MCNETENKAAQLLSADGSYTLQTEGLNARNISDFGVNILSGCTPEIQDANGNPLKPMWGGDIAFVVQCEYLQHIDIWGTLPVTVTYDMGEEIEAEQTVVASMYHPDFDYSTGQYELYFSANRSDLYDEKNCVVHYNNNGVWKKQQPLTGAAQVYRFSHKPKGRYFGIRVLDANPVDQVIRIGRLAVYNSAYTRQHSYFSRFGNNLLENAALQAHDRNDGIFWPQYGDWKMLTDGVVAGEYSTVELRVKETPAMFRFRLDKALCPNTLVVVGNKSYMPRIEVYVSQNEPDLLRHMVEITDVTTEEVLGETISRIISFREIKNARFAAVLLYPEAHDKIIQVDQIGLFSDNRTVKVMENEVVNPEFWGIGANLVPFTLQPGNLKAGYTKAHWALDRKRILVAKPRMVRVWAQIDWMEKAKGKYSFDTPEMEGLYRYCEVFQEAGTEIQLTFSWKVGEEAQSWYAITGIDRPYESAPADIAAYARSCSALLQELWKRGYDNVRHFTIANEPNLGDFMCFGDPREYYVKVIHALDRQLKEDGIRDRVKIWTTECVTDYSWLTYLEEQAGDCIDVTSMHEYGAVSDDIAPMMDQIMSVSSRPFIMSEFAEGAFDLCAWKKGYAGYIINGVNHGMSGLLNWTLCGVKSMSVTEPDSWELSGYGDLWRPLLSGGKPQKSYYIVSMLMRYLPPHSKVLKSILSETDFRAAVFQADDGIVSILVENNIGLGRRLTLDLPKSMDGCVFYKHQYFPPEVMEEDNTIVPPVRGKFVSNGGFSDVMENQYAVTVYTTMAPQTQIVMDQVWAEVKPGGSLTLSASVLDHDDGIVWSVTEGGGIIDQNGCYQAPEDSGYAAVKAASDTDPEAYGITVIRID